MSISEFVGMLASLLSGRASREVVPLCAGSWRRVCQMLHHLWKVMKDQQTCLDFGTFIETVVHNAGAALGL